MSRVSFTPNIQRHVACGTKSVTAGSVRDALKAALTGNERAWGYIFDDQGALRQHMVVFVNGQQVLDRRDLSDELPPHAEVFVMQALSGG